MRLRSKKSLFLILIISILPGIINSQVLESIRLSTRTGLAAESYLLADSTLIKPETLRPLFSFLCDGRYRTASDVEAGYIDGYHILNFDKGLQLLVKSNGKGYPGLRWEVIFENRGSDTLIISDVIPFGEDRSSVYIKGDGPWDLARAWLHRPDHRPLRVILPDNAWELGFSAYPVSNAVSVAALARRISVDGGTRRRYETELIPGAKVTYHIYADTYRGQWQDGMKLMFRDRYLYDLEVFDNSLFERPDLQWIKSSYLIVLQYPWDIEYYDPLSGKYTFGETLKEFNDLFGHIDVFGIWPTWPRLGLDRRNQWDLYRNLPGGTDQLRSFSRLLRQYGTRFFIAYNPWDNSTREEDHLGGMAEIIRLTEADGVVLDTKGSSSMELQMAADSVRTGVVMFSEGMAVVKDMPGIISGRVHNAILLSPELNLNKIIKPDFAIFRVGDVGEERLRREIAISFFNGYGMELNMFRPGGRNDLFRDDMRFLAATTRILRDNSNAFLDSDWTPLIPTDTDNVFVNRWRDGEKTIFTVLNMNDHGYDGFLFDDHYQPDFHYVSLWHHEELNPFKSGMVNRIPVTCDGWGSRMNGTRGEGSVDCIARFPRLLKVERNGWSVAISSQSEGTIEIWKGNPSTETIPLILESPVDTLIPLKELFGHYQGKIVLRLFTGENLRDERIVKFDGGTPVLVSATIRTELSAFVPAGMVLVPGNSFSYKVSANDNFIPHPLTDTLRSVTIDSFLIDIYPVTNEAYFEFIRSTGYKPRDTVNYLRHWTEGFYRSGQGSYPVVWISPDDARAYAAWAGKRLPTEDEWQLAAQGTDGRTWPWGNEFYGTRSNNSFDRMTPVDAFSKGASPYGVQDMVGNVWQMTADTYFNGNNYFIIIRGGSFYKPESSWWYIQGGPQSLDKTQMLLLVSPGFDRSETLGFRCVQDINTKEFRARDH
ncbi:MAG: formylglycine-generating enzyme family protein [Bacteroidetes bacterium]|nr:formylglycine-generating enzyme family protein [Bacteroidota bacterium]